MLHTIVIFESQILASGRRKLHLGSLARALGRLKISVVLLEAGPAGEQAVRKLADESVISLNRIVVALTLDGNPILSARQFVLQPQKVLVRFELRIILNHRQQAPESAIKLPVGRDLVR